MAGQHERRSKCRFDSSSDIPMAGIDEGGSSHPNVVSGRELRPRGQKRVATDDIMEESDESSSSDEETEDEIFRVEHRAGKGPAQQNSSEEEAAAGSDSGDDDEEGSDSNNDTGVANAPVITRPRYPFGRAPTNYFGDGMTEIVRR